MGVRSKFADVTEALEWAGEDIEELDCAAALGDLAPTRYRRMRKAVLDRAVQEMLQGYDLEQAMGLARFLDALDHFNPTLMEDIYERLVGIRNRRMWRRGTSLTRTKVRRISRLLKTA